MAGLTLSGPDVPPERPKGAKDKVKRPEGPPAISWGPEGPLNFYIGEYLGGGVKLFLRSCMAALLCRLQIASGLHSQEILGKNEFIGSWQQPQKGQKDNHNALQLHAIIH